MYNVPPPVDISKKPFERIRDWYDTHIMEFNKNPRVKDFLELSVDNEMIDFSKLKIYLVPFLGKNTEKFIFTFFSYLKSPFSSIGFDQSKEPPMTDTNRQKSRIDKGKSCEYSDYSSDYSNHYYEKGKNHPRAAKRHHRHRLHSSTHRDIRKNSSTSSSKHRHHHRRSPKNYDSYSDCSGYSCDEHRMKKRSSKGILCEPPNVSNYRTSAEKAAMLTLVKQLIQQNSLFESDNEII